MTQEQTNVNYEKWCMCDQFDYTKHVWKNLKRQTKHVSDAMIRGLKKVWTTKGLFVLKPQQLASAIINTATTEVILHFSCVSRVGSIRDRKSELPLLLLFLASHLSVLISCSDWKIKSLLSRLWCICVIVAVILNTLPL